MKDKQQRIGDGLPFQRNLGQLIVSHFHAGGRIQVGSELQSDTFEPADHAVTGKMPGSVERHVFEEVSQPGLGIVFLYGTYVVDYVEIRHSCGLTVVAQEVSHSVVEFTDTHGCIQRKLITHFQGLSDDCARSRKQKQGSTDTYKE